MTLRSPWGRATLAACLTAVTGLSSTPAQASAPQVKTQAPGYYRYMLGDFEITVLSDGTVPQEVEKLLHAPPAKVQSLLSAAYLTSPVETSINAYLINTGTALYLVDTGAGELFGPAGGHLVTALRAAGYQPEQIDAVLLTHIHGDHSGGLMMAGKPVFPNAVVYAHQREAAYWLDAANVAKAAESHKPYFQEARAALSPYVAAGKLKTFEGNAELLPGIWTQEAPGHTPGHTFYVARSQGQKLVFWGDIMHVAAVQFADPSVTIQYDVDSKAAAAQRAKAYADAAKQGYTVAGDHVSFPGLGRLKAQGKGYAWVPVNYAIPR
ncbi:MBL fold metallo-hydrolase [Melittangium boletus]|uniref:MBL fold metallo-hydrolase n=1 Tax=Melittangium boletus TaxID=83453 RepID=UPI003DA47284